MTSKLSFDESLGPKILGVITPVCNVDTSVVFVFSVATISIVDACFKMKTLLVYFITDKDL